MNYNFRKAEVTDISEIWVILQQAIKRRKNEGSNQWQDGYPNLEVVKNDIQNMYSKDKFEIRLKQYGLVLQNEINSNPEKHGNIEFDNIDLVYNLILNSIYDYNLSFLDVHFSILLLYKNFYIIIII